jgi:hypothetical protein
MAHRTHTTVRLAPLVVAVAVVLETPALHLVWVRQEDQVAVGVVLTAQEPLAQYRQVTSLEAELRTRVAVEAVAVTLPGVNRRSSLAVRVAPA